jgi:hypothetical protein
MAKPNMENFEVKPRSLDEIPAAKIEPVKEKATGGKRKAPVKAVKPVEVATQEPEPAKEPETKTPRPPRQPKALASQSEQPAAAKRPYHRKRESLKKQGYGYKGFMVKDEYFLRFNELRQAMKEDHGEEAGVVLINEALELLFRKHKGDLQKYYEQKLSNI